jgi:signal transduction histidine kinase
MDEQTTAEDPKNKPSAVPVADGNGNLQQVNESLYKQNLEIVVKNKTLSLLGKLYEISILALEPKELAEKVTATIREELEFELVGLFLHHAENDEFSPLQFAQSEIFQKTCEELKSPMGEIVIPASANSFLETIIRDKNTNVSNTLASVWGGVISTDILKKVEEMAHVQTVLAFPLIIKGKVIGLLVYGFNQVYDVLNDFEKERIRSVVNVTAVALDKALLYEELRVANEKLKSVDKLKTEFLGLASHQLRSPLTAIKGYSSMLSEGSFGAVTPEQKVAIDRVFQSSNNLARVVEDLLDVSKIEQGGMKFVFAPVDMEKLCNDLSEELKLVAANKNLVLSFEKKSEGPFMVNADQVKIRQVILNLVDNSIKYTPNGFVKILLSRDEAVKKITAAITDSGMGISPEGKTRLFEKFSRGEGQKVNAGGSGLGLYLVKQIVEEHHGRVWADSPGIGLGSTFSVELPAA